MLSGKRILVLEDEPIVQMMLEDLLEELGAIVVGPASCVAQADALIDSEQLDAAILDLNLGGENSHSIAERLRGNGVPFVFATGYGTAGDGRLDHEQVIHKPYRRGDIAAAVGRALSGGATRP